jgi:hypothetical protein
VVTAPQPKRRDPPDSLGDDRNTHLGTALGPFPEDDRHLDDPQPGPGRPPGELHLERVAGRSDRAEFDRPKGFASPALEATGQISLGKTEHPRRVKASTTGQAPSEQAPVLDPATIDVPGPDRQICAVSGAG